MALKVADMAHLAAPSSVHEVWVGALENEFFKQGDEEKSLDMPVTRLMDREQPGVHQTQV